MRPRSRGIALSDTDPSALLDGMENYEGTKNALAAFEAWSITRCSNRMLTHLVVLHSSSLYRELSQQRAAEGQHARLNCMMPQQHHTCNQDFGKAIVLQSPRAGEHVSAD